VIGDDRNYRIDMNGTSFSFSSPSSLTSSPLHSSSSLLINEENNHTSIPSSSSSYSPATLLPSPADLCSSSSISSFSSSSASSSSSPFSSSRKISSRVSSASSHSNPSSHHYHHELSETTTLLLPVNKKIEIDEDENEMDSQVKKGAGHLPTIEDWDSIQRQLQSSKILSSILFFFLPLSLLLTFFPSLRSLFSSSSSSSSSLSSFFSFLLFFIHFISIIPLAWLLSFSTEELALRTNSTLGGLLNATFGNAVELIVSIVALKKGRIRLVQTSLLGSILSNMLLVLGMSFFLGGIRFSQQTYNRKGASIFTSMLLLACIALAVPSAYSHSFSPPPSLDSLLTISRMTATIIFLVYILYLIFQLITHVEIFEESEADGEEEEDEESDLSTFSALFLLGLVTILVTICSDSLISSISGFTHAWQINESFVGMILIPIVGNAAEHATAVSVAMKNKLDLSIGVAIGSSTQIALFLIPFVTLLGWGIGQPMTLDFTVFETVILVLSVLIVNFLVKDGESNWLEGVMLMCAYGIIAIAFFYHPVEITNEGGET